MQNAVLDKFREFLDQHRSEPCVFVFSDMHIRSENDAIAKLFTEMSECIANSTMGSSAPFSTVFLGDIFDFYFGEDRYFHEKFKFFAEGLKKIASKAERVLFVPGNHEFFVTQSPWPKVEFVEETIWRGKLSGIPLSLTHGDLIYCSTNYKLFRALIFSWPATTLARTIPAKWLDAYSLNHAENSRQRSIHKPIDTDALQNSFNQTFANDQSQYVIFGHFHTSLVWQSNAKTFINLPSWETPNILALSPTRASRFLVDPASASAKIETISQN